MPSVVATVERIQRAVTLLRAVDDVDAGWLAECVETWLAGAPWDAAVGLSEGWRDHVLRRRQDTALAALAAALGAMSGRAAACTISARLTRYESTAWPRDRAAGRRPTGPDGPAYDYLAAKGPTSPASVRRKLSDMEWLTAALGLSHGAK